MREKTGLGECLLEELAIVRGRLSGEMDLDFVFLAITLVNKSLFILE